MGRALLFTIGAVLLYLLATRIFGPGEGVEARVIDFSQSAEQIQELSTMKSHMRMGVVVREKDGNVIVRRLADQAEYIGMDRLSNALFQDPTMFVELHGVATYGLNLRDLKNRITQDDSTVQIALPKARVLDVKLVPKDTRIVAQMKGLFRSSNSMLLLEADRQGEEFVLEYAEQDTAMLALAEQRARDLLTLLVERSGKRAVFN